MTLCALKMLPLRTRALSRWHVKNFSNLEFELIEWLRYSPDLASLDYYRLFLKKKLTEIMYVTKKHFVIFFKIEQNVKLLKY